jgi:sialic acid synthase SpsE
MAIDTQQSQGKVVVHFPKEKVDKPIIASTAGASLEEIDKVVSFLEHRDKTFATFEECVDFFRSHYGAKSRR